MIYTSDKENNVFTAIHTLSHRFDEFHAYCVELPLYDWLHIENNNTTEQCEPLYTHLVDWYYGKDFKGDTEPIKGAFSEIKPNLYISSIINGTNPKYKQESVRARCLAFLENVINKNELWNWQIQVKKLKDNRVSKDNVFSNIVNITEIDPNKRYIIKCSSDISNSDFNRLCEKVNQFSSNVILFKGTDN